MAGKDQEHSSQANPDNRIELERQAADQEHAQQIAQNPPTDPEGQPVPQPKGMTRVVRNRKGQRERIEVPSTGHSWDGIEEYDNPLPRWWLWAFFISVIWAVLYLVAYPAVPLFKGPTQGVLGYSAREDVATEIQRFDEANASIREKLVQTEMEDIAQDPELVNYTNHAGRAVFQTWCAQCHGQGGGGAVGYPNLLDNDWLWGGEIEEIYTTVQHGIRDPIDEDSRFSQMPAFGRDGVLDRTEIGQVTEYVLQISGQGHDAAKAAAGAEIFADNCSACHADDGTGDRFQGAPDLTDAIWLYRGDRATITRMVNEGPFAVMPAWAGRLSDADIRSVASYVHSLGGGE